MRRSAPLSILSFKPEAMVALEERIRLYFIYSIYKPALSVSAPITPSLSRELISLGLSSLGYAGVSLSIENTHYLHQDLFCSPLTTMDPLDKRILFPLGFFIFHLFSENGQRMPGRGEGGCAHTLFMCMCVPVYTREIQAL